MAERSQIIPHRVCISSVNRASEFPGLNSCQYTPSPELRAREPLFHEGYPADMPPNTMDIPYNAYHPTSRPRSAAVFRTDLTRYLTPCLSDLVGGRASSHLQWITFGNSLSRRGLRV